MLIVLMLPLMLAVEEALPAGTPPVARVEAPLTVGVPFTEADGVKDASELALADGRPAQFRALSRHPSGLIQVALLETRAEPGTLTVVRATAPPPAPMPVPTVIPGRPLGGSLRLVRGGVVYASENDPGATVTIESTGPVRTVVRLDGALVSSARAAIGMDYTMRLSYVVGHARVGVNVTLRHASKPQSNRPPPVRFDSVSLVIPVTGGARASIGVTGREVVVAPIRSEVTAYQGYNVPGDTGHTWGCRATRVPPLYQSGCRKNKAVFEQNGIEVRANGTTVVPLGNADETLAGWADLSDARGAGVTVAHRYTPSYWPVGFTVTPSSISVDLFSPRNSMKDIPFAWGAHETRYLLVDWHTGPAAGPAVIAELEAPLVARAPFEQYRDSGIFWGETRLASMSEYARWLEQRKGLVSKPSMGRYAIKDFPKVKVDRFYYWPSPERQTTLQDGYLLDWVRAGLVGRYLTAIQQTQFNADQAVRHSDGYDFTETPRVAPPPGRLHGFNGVPFDFQHLHWFSLWTAYLFTGEERLKESLTDLLEHFLVEARAYASRPIAPNERAWARIVSLWAGLWEVIRDDRARERLMTALDGFLDGRDEPFDPDVGGRDPERGFAYGRRYAWQGQGRISRPLIFSRIIPAQLLFVRGVLRRVPGTYGRVAEFEDALEGYARWVYHEPYFQRVPIPRPGARHDEYGYMERWPCTHLPGRFCARYHLDFPNIDPGPQFKNVQMIQYDYCAGGAYLWDRTGDPKYLDRAAILMYGAHLGGGDGTSEWQCARMIWTDLRRPTGTQWRTIPVTVEPVSGTTYRLRWEAPAGVQEYEVRAAAKPIVDWLGFDQVTRTWQYDPKAYVHTMMAPALPLKLPVRRAGPQEALIELPAGEPHVVLRAR